MTADDKFMLKLTAWRENRGGPQPNSMQSIINVVINRAVRDNTSPYDECKKPWQFTSITGKGDPQTTLWAESADPRWLQAEQLVEMADSGTLPDITGGATLYYNPHGLAEADIAPEKVLLPVVGAVNFPLKWNRNAVRFTASIGGHLFFKESQPLSLTA